MDNFPEITIIPEKVRTYYDLIKGVGAAALHLVGDHIHYALNKQPTEPITERYDTFELGRDSRGSGFNDYLNEP